MLFRNHSAAVGGRASFLAVLVCSSVLAGLWRPSSFLALASIAIVMPKSKGSAASTCSSKKSLGRPVTVKTPGVLKKKRYSNDEVQKACPKLECFQCKQDTHSFEADLLPKKGCSSAGTSLIRVRNQRLGESRLAGSVTRASVFAAGTSQKTWKN